MHDTLRTTSVSDLEKVVSSGLCIGCGICSIPLTTSDDAKAQVQVSLEWSAKDEIWVPRVEYSEAQSTEQRVCPGARVDMKALSNDMFGAQPDEGLVGHYQSIHAGYATDPTVRKKAASGGVTTALLKNWFDQGTIDVAYTTAGLNPHHGQGQLTRNSDDLGPSCGSHYHPVNYGAALQELVEGNERFALVGLPCEISAMREIMRHRSDVTQRCVALIGLFCGGINRFSGIAKYLQHFDVQGTQVEEIDYRDGTWPGQIAVSEKGKTQSTKIPRVHGNSRWNILRYMVSFQGYWMLPRCRVCPDQISDFADIAVGDPHLPRFKQQDSLGVSAIVSRTEQGEKLLNEAVARNVIALEELSKDELITSQGYTLENRRFSDVTGRMAQKLGMPAPELNIYDDVKGALSWHQNIYAFVDLGKIKVRHWAILKPFYMAIQIFEYLFLTFSPRLIFSRAKKILSNK